VFSLLQFPSFLLSDFPRPLQFVFLSQLRSRILVLGLTLLLKNSITVRELLLRIDQGQCVPAI
jgi:hypothetical protein